MKKILSSRVILLLAAAALAGGALAEPAQDITIEASRIVKKQVRGPSVVKVEELSFSQRVDYGDLDLGTPAGMTALESRVHTAALEACGEITREYPFARPGDLRCARAATRETMVDVRELLAAQ